MTIYLIFFFYIYRPQTKFAKVMFLHLTVSHFVHMRGLHPRGLHPGCLHPGKVCIKGGRGSALGGGICIQRGLHPRGVCIQGFGQTFRPPRILWDTVNERAVRILLECILVWSCFGSRPRWLNVRVYVSYNIASIIGPLYVYVFY